MRRNPFPVRVIIMKEFCLLCKDTFDSFWWLSKVAQTFHIKFYIAPHIQNIDVQGMKISYIFLIQRQPASNYDVPGRWLKEGRNISLTKTRVNNLLVNIDADYEFVKVLKDCRWHKSWQLSVDGESDLQRTNSVIHNCFKDEENVKVGRDEILIVIKVY